MSSHNDDFNGLNDLNAIELLGLGFDRLDNTFMDAPVSVQAGSIQLIQTWGSDEAIITAARQSTQKGFKGWGTTTTPGDEKLLAYLYTHKHMTPFEMCGATFDVTLPIFVAREWMRHRTMSYSEASARYAPLPNSHYVPTLARLTPAMPTPNKQAQSVCGEPLATFDAELWTTRLAKLIEHSQQVYNEGLAIGVPKELARLSNLVTRHTYMRVSANLRNWMQFMVLRQDGAAQLEIREYADAINTVLSVVFPRSMSLFNDGQSKVAR